MALTVNQLLEVTVLGRAQGQEILNVFHYRSANPATYPPAGEDLNEFSDNFLGTWRTNILTLVSSTYNVEIYRFRSLISTVEIAPGDPPDRRVVQGDALDVPGTVTDVGTRGGDVLPTFAALGVRKATDRAGRRYRGSFRLSPLTEADTNNNSLTTAYLFSANAETATFVNTQLLGGFGDAAQLELAVFSETAALEETPPQTNLRQFTAKVIGRVVNPFVTTQVSRKQSATQPT
jgi:hypothetical protein